MRRRRRLRFAVLGGLAAGLVGAGALVGAGLAVSPSDLPNLTIDFPNLDDGRPARWVDTAEAPGKVLYRFDTVILNRGPGALDIVSAAATDQPTAANGYLRNDTAQVIWENGALPGPVSTGTPAPTPQTPGVEEVRNLGGAGQIFYSPLTGHVHFHTPLVAKYELVTADGRPVAAAAKNDAGFCFFDSWIGDGPGWFEQAGPGTGGLLCHPGDSGFQGTVRMGLSPGEGDLYNSQLGDQWVDVSDVMPGSYRLRGTANPAGLFTETTPADNVGEVPVTIPGGAPDPASASTAAGVPVTIPLSGRVVGADVRSRAPDCDDIDTFGCMAQADPRALRFALAAAPPAAQGSVSFDGATATFTPAPRFTGTASFSYRAIDSRGLGGVATVTVQVKGPGGPGGGGPGGPDPDNPGNPPWGPNGPNNDGKGAGGLPIACIGDLAVPSAPPAGAGNPEKVMLSRHQLLINQRISSAAVRRVNTATDKLTAGLTGADFRACSLSTADFDQSLLAAIRAGAAAGPAGAVGTPRATPTRTARPPQPGKVTLSRKQLVINQRISSAAVRRVNALRQRLDGNLTGGDILRGTLTAASLEGTARNWFATGLPAGTGTSTTFVPLTLEPAEGHPERIVLSKGQLLINQRISSAAVRRVNQITRELKAGLTGINVKDTSLDRTNLTPGVQTGAQ